LNKVAAGWRKVGRMLDGASRGDKIALRSIFSPIVPAHSTHRFPFQQTTVIGSLLVWENGDRVWSKELILWAELEHI
jgi:hypothetical protein